MTNRKISIIAAVAKNGVIGKNGTLPWHLKKDFAWFVQQTKNKIVVMGRKNYEDIIQFTKGKPLKDRTNIVLTKQKFSHEGFISYDSIEKLLNDYPKDDLMIIGGTQIYEQFLPYTNEIILTEIDKIFDGDTYFPEWDRTVYNLEYSQREEENELIYYFNIYKRIL